MTDSTITPLDFFRLVLPEPDLEQDERIELRHISGGGFVNQFWSHTAEEAAALVPSLVGSGALYYGATVRQGEHGDAAHVSRVSSVWSDLDFKCFDGGGHGAGEAIAAFPVQPSVIVFTGGGYQPQWCLVEPYDRDDEHRLRAVMRGIRRWFSQAADRPLDTVDDLARVLRVPGSLNCKYSPPSPCHGGSLRS